MDAQEFVNRLRTSNRLVRLTHFDHDEPDGQAFALIIDSEHNLAVMLEDCNPEDTKVARGAVVRFAKHPEADARIIGEPAYVTPIIVGGIKLGKAP